MNFVYFICSYFISYLFHFCNFLLFYFFRALQENDTIRSRNLILESKQLDIIVGEKEKLGNIIEKEKIKIRKNNENNEKLPGNLTKIDIDASDDMNNSVDENLNGNSAVSVNNNLDENLPENINRNLNTNSNLNESLVANGNLNENNLNESFNGNENLNGSLIIMEGGRSARLCVKIKKIAQEKEALKKVRDISFDLFYLHFMWKVHFHFYLQSNFHFYLYVDTEMI